MQLLLFSLLLGLSSSSFDLTGNACLDPGSYCRVDLLSASTYDDKIALYVGATSSSPHQHVLSINAKYARAVDAADLDGDGHWDVLSASLTQNKVAWYQSYGNGSFSPEKIISTDATLVVAVLPLDVDDDGCIDVVAGGASSVWYWRNLGSSGFSPTKIPIGSLGGTVRSVAVADLDGDTLPDVVAVGDLDIAWWHNYGNGSFIATKNILALSSARAVWPADVTGNGRVDIVVGGINGVAWYRNMGNGMFSDANAITNTSARSVHAADLDGDGLVDILVGGDNDVTWWRNVGQGTFDFIPNVLTSTAMVARAVYALDTDVVFASGDGNSIQWCRNLGDGAFSPPQTVTTSVDEPWALSIIVQRALCRKGSGSEQGDSTCTACAAGRWSNTIDTTSCEACTAGRWSMAIGAPNISTCSACAPGRWSPSGASTCTECEAGHQSAVASSSCTVCGHGLFEVANACIQCPTDSVCLDGVIAKVCRDYDEPKGGTCVHSHCFCVDNTVLYGILALLVVPVPLVFCASGITSRGIWILTLFSLGDLATDISYVLQQPYRASWLQYACVAALFAQIPCFLYVLRPDWKVLIAPAKRLCMTWVRLSDKRGECILDLVTVLFNCIRFVMGVLWVMLGVPTLAAVGFYLFALKLLPVKAFARRFSVYWNPALVRETMGGTSRFGMAPLFFHASVVSELLLETLPQLLLQIFNNGGNNWTVVALVSLLFSCIIVFNHFYRYAYWLLVARVPLADVPLHWNDRHSAGDDEPDAFIEMDEQAKF